MVFKAKVGSMPIAARIDAGNVYGILALFNHQSISGENR
jgi:hypothetical protein